MNVYFDLRGVLMFGNKGQAFDTFKLMIAAVIAVAILGILLAILSGIIFPGQDPATMMKQQLQQATQYPGSIFVSQTQADFKAGVQYVQGSFADVLGGAGYKVDFICGVIVRSGCTTGTNIVTISGDFKAVVKACCTSSNQCKVGIGSDASISC